MTRFLQILRTSCRFPTLEILLLLLTITYMRRANANPYVVFISPSKPQS